MKKIFLVLLFFILVGCAEEEQADNEKIVDTKDLPQNERLTDNQELLSSNEVREDNSIIKDAVFGVVPQKISIPAIKVNSHVEKVGVLENGQMGVPEDPANTGWFELGTKPGGRGSAVIAGHVDDKTGPAVFYHLDALEKGDEVIITGKDGTTLTFEVVSMKIFPKDEAPVSKIFGYSSRRILNLVTCTGTFDRSKGTHLDRLVVQTELKKNPESTT